MECGEVDPLRGRRVGGQTPSGPEHMLAPRHHVTMLDIAVSACLAADADRPHVRQGFQACFLVECVVEGK